MHLSPFLASFLDGEAVKTLVESLGEEDRQALAEMVAAADGHRMAIDHSGHPVPGHVVLFSLLLEEHKQVLRLRQALEDSPPPEDQGMAHPCAGEKG